ncbi:MAG TPA: ribonuclease H-like domain-containing protein [Deltaproteobacteria bacterium]|nr:ribonuclease H-like domain-containing protein [Deltaproteobacteria bacterium]HPR55707.1 ribonuclease H-like domain-containing protein [Deltaproteobacteria bacterium]
MSLKDRLGRLTGESRKPDRPDPRQDTISDLRRKIDEVMNRRDRLVRSDPASSRRPGMPLEEAVTGEEVVTDRGRFFFSRSRMEETDRHGHALIRDLALIDMGGVGILAGSDAFTGFSPEDALFMDTETTGLAGGTGTFPFLIGLGWFESGTFVTCQLFARDFPEEAPMLAYLQELAADRKFLVSFNGRAYDLNLLTARFILNRQRDTLSGMPHLDLLHPGRRLLRHRMDNARLVTIEACVLGLERDGDVPGWEIPQRYFEWLRRRDGRLMEDVFRHNRFDIVSMASLLKHLTDLVGCGANPEGLHHGDVLAAARLHHERGDLLSARSLYEGILLSPDREVSLAARRSLSLIHKRAGAWEEAALIWDAMLSQDPYDPFAAEELAKYHEHRRHDYGRAAMIVRTVLEGCSSLSDEERNAFEHRLHRLAFKASSR